MKFEIGDSKIHGKGLFATEKIPKGEIVVTWHPKVLSLEEASKLPAYEQDHFLYKEGEKVLWMQPPEKYMNHSCDPNTKAAGKSDLAVRDIEPGEEITTDYIDSETEDFECNCGLVNCRKSASSKVSSNHQKILIEPAKPEDSEVICKIRDDAWLVAYPNEELGLNQETIRINAQGLKGEFVPRRIAWLKDKTANTNENWMAWVAKVDNVVRGFVIASTDEKNRKFLNSIYVDPTWQGKGLGKELMNQALDWLDRKNDIYLEVAAHNQKSIDFYKKLGFVETGAELEEEADRPDYITPIPQLEMVLKSTKSSD